jgi:uncharacterized membrane protein HdeD (DUF308 family)
MRDDASGTSDAGAEDPLIPDELARQRRHLGRTLVIGGAVIVVAGVVVQLLGVAWVVSLITLGAVLIFQGVRSLIKARKVVGSARERQRK